MRPCSLTHVCALVVVAQISILGEAVKGNEEQYSTNAICRQNNCINPVFPGLDDLSTLEVKTWECRSNQVVHKYLQFCKQIVNYDVALPSPNRSMPMGAAVREQEKAAVTTYFYHLAGMNIEAADFKDPMTVNDPCIRAVWIMACHTHFPKAEAGCQDGQQSAYLQPCQNVCGQYVKACDVQCCDESVKCVFDEEVILMDGSKAKRHGYADALGPSRTCTGGSFSGSRHAGTLTLTASLLALISAVLQLSPEGGGRATFPSSGISRCALFGMLAIVATSLQGCNLISRTVAWDAKPSYVMDFQFLPVKETPRGAQLLAAQAVLNSCQVPGLNREMQCSGNGICKQWNASSVLTDPIFFCECDRDWADPECRTRRKSQATAFMLSLFGGFLGLDHFYLSEYITGVCKLATLGGIGLWWVGDIVRIGASPIYASEFRLAPDLPHWIYVGLSVGVFSVLGYLILGVWGSARHSQRKLAKMMLEAEKHFFKAQSGAVRINAQDTVGTRARTSAYGTI